jgi:hypothetical protein
MCCHDSVYFIRNDPEFPDGAPVLESIKVKGPMLKFLKYFRQIIWRKKWPFLVQNTASFIAKFGS